jgi:hypothetical protein
MNTVDLAVYYSKLGWQSFQCKPRDKTPLHKWADVATTEENMLLGWWDTNPAANIGIACGKRSGIIVLDVDADHGGYESLAALQDTYGRLPETPVSRTGSGGEHIVFQHPGIEIRNSAGKLGAGLDIRGDGGYIVAPPSVHPNGQRYEWVVRPSQVPLAPMPEWLIELLQERQAAAPTPSTDGMIIAGGRNDALFRLASGMRNKGFDEDAIFAALQIYNRKHCAPPLNDGEVLLITKSSIRYQPKDEYKTIAALPNAWDVIEKIEAKIIERQTNPVDVWGIHYAWKYISRITGGKQRGELIILAGEPGVGKSWWAHQDALYTAVGSPKDNIPSTPVLVWSGEMSREQVYRRMIEMMGVSKRHMLTGNMSSTDWEFFNEAKAIIMNSPIYVSDAPLDLKDIRTLLEREQAEHGVEQVVIDYDWLVNAPGQNEIEKSQNVSRTMKQLARELNLSIVLISSVNKMGMDSVSENVSKSNVSGSGKKLHDADVIYIMTKFNERKNGDMTIPVSDYDKISTLHISKGRELDYHIPNGAINYQRETPSPRFKELKDMNTLPDWMKK